MKKSPKFVVLSAVVIVFLLTMACEPLAALNRGVDAALSSQEATTTTTPTTAPADQTAAKVQDNPVAQTTPAADAAQPTATATLAPTQSPQISNSNTNSNTNVVKVIVVAGASGSGEGAGNGTGSSTSGNTAPAAQETPAPETKAPEAKATAVATAQATAEAFVVPCDSPAPQVEEPLQLRDMWQSICFHEAKVVLPGNIYACVAVENGASYPAGTTEIESVNRNPVSDGNFITAGLDNPWGLSGYCNSTPADFAGPKNVAWSLGFITKKDGFVQVTKFGPDVKIPALK